MDVGNPYEAPRAQVGSVAAAGSDSELAWAVADLVAARGPLIAIAVFAVVAALASCVTTVTFLVFREYTAVTYVLLMTAASALGYFAMAVMLVRVALSLKTLDVAPTFTKVAAALNTMAQTWIVGMVTLVLPTVAAQALRFMPLSPAAVLAAGAAEGASNVVDAAQRLRNVVLTFLAVGAGILLLSFASLVISPLGMSAMTLGALPIQTRFWMFGGAVFQVAFGWLVWRQVPALDAFIAQPNVATLSMFAAAYRLLWRVTAWGGLAAAILGFIGSVVAMFFLAL